ncbi:MAG: DUF4430 domain-containing protein [Clostridia bacterium]|nr:DUF4430 domain-containing protein [Clostridia bacterium]
MKKTVWCLSLLLVLSFALSLCPSCGKEERGETVKISFVCVDAGGEERTYGIVTDRRYLGDALRDERLIEGRGGQYGTFVTEVCGMRADPDTDGAYWALYVDGEYSLYGVDSTKLKDGSVYSFVYTAL